jgi:hypothetical protein
VRVAESVNQVYADSTHGEGDEMTTTCYFCQTRPGTYAEGVFVTPDFYDNTTSHINIRPLCDDADCRADAEDNGLYFLSTPGDPEIQTEYARAIAEND